MSIKKLSEVLVGSTCIIVDILNNVHDIDDRLLLKLMELGFMKGERLTILHKASKSGPICVQIHGHHSSLSLRINEASNVIVKQISN